MSNPKWCTKHSQYAHDCSDCAALSTLAPIVDAVLNYRPKNKAKNLRPKKRKKAK